MRANQIHEPCERHVRAIVHIRIAKSKSICHVYSGSTQRSGKSMVVAWPYGDLQGALLPLATESLLSFFLFSAFPLVFFLLSPSTYIRWRIVLLKRVLLTNGSLFLSFSAFSFFLFFSLSLSTEIRGSSNHHCQRWNSDRKIRENDRVAARQSSKASMKNLRGEISRELRLSRSS